MEVIYNSYIISQDVTLINERQAGGSYRGVEERNPGYLG